MHDSQQNARPKRQDEELNQILDQLGPSRTETGEGSEGLSGSATAEDGCPGPDQWIQFALGEAPASQADSLFAHAANCSPCARLLRQSLRLLKAEPAAEEQDEFKTYQSSEPAWSRSLAAQLAASPRKLSRRPPAWTIWSGALAASLLLALSGAFLWMRMNAPERLLAQAYAHERSFEFRIPGAAYAAVTPGAHLRGADGGRQSAWLLDAHARIERKLERTPNNARWLQMEARADLLEEKYDAAIDILDRLIAAGPVTASLLADDAAAYYQRGAAMGSENDRAAALDYLRRADELSPDDPVILFNEAIALEDRGQVMNAVETWNRFLRFERDPNWLSEGRARLAALEQKLARLKSHQSRLERRLATPAAMRALAADPKALASYGEELVSDWLPDILKAAFIAPVDRSRGSPCKERCLAARLLLGSLALSLQKEHQDPWLIRFLPASSPAPKFLTAAQKLADGLAALRDAKFNIAIPFFEEAQKGFRALGNPAGVDLAQVDIAFAYHRNGNGSLKCYKAVHPVVGRNPEFAWIQIYARIQDTLCDPAPGVDAEEHRPFEQYQRMAQQHGYSLLEMRAGNMRAVPAVNSKDEERAWRIYAPIMHKFWEGDFPAYRLLTTLAGLAELESNTPRTRLALMLQRETLDAAQLAHGAAQLVPAQRMNLAYAALRAGSLHEAQQQMAKAQAELAASQDPDSVRSEISEVQLQLSEYYTAHRDFSQAKKILDEYFRLHRDYLLGYIRRKSGVAEGEFELASGQPGMGEKLLHDAIVEEEQDARSGDAQYITWAHQQRDSYATETGLWLAHGRPAVDALALWERYRLRILDLPAQHCPGDELNCLLPQVRSALTRLQATRLIGMIVLLDRTLIYEYDKDGLRWSSVPAGREELLAAASRLEQAVNSPNVSQASVDQAAQRVGKMLFDGLRKPLKPGEALLLEPDPLLGNLPWPAVETAAGPLGLQFDLIETPSIALEPGVTHTSGSKPPTNPSMVIGSSLGAGAEAALPEVLDEARTVARYYARPDLLLARRATLSSVTARLNTAPVIHFAGHAVRRGGAARLLLAPEPKTGSLAHTALQAPYIDSALFRANQLRAARLIVFSACATGQRNEDWNNGVGDIVNTLAGLGVPEVVATRWQIDSDSAVTMMNGFYRELSHGASVAHALTSARRTLAADSRYRHPYYWAAYYDSGSARAQLDGIFHPPSR
jgi:CHAT domain-containing protein/tetratricopeptide (TPR) repeat protein